MSTHPNPPPAGWYVFTYALFLSGHGEVLNITCQSRPNWLDTDEAPVLLRHLPVHVSITYHGDGATPNAEGTPYEQ